MIQQTPPTQVNQDTNLLTSALISVFFAIIAWTVYVILITIAPMPFANDTLRAIARVSIVLFPALIHVMRQPENALDYLQLRSYWFRGLVVGALVAGIYLALFIASTMQNPTLQLSDNFAIWFNFIIGSPFAEELLFRGVLFNELKRVVSAYWAIAISAILFAVLHLPVWLMLDGMALPTALQSFVQISLYGVVFAMLMHVTKSLWASLTAHWLNNFILLSIVDSIIS